VGRVHKALVESVEIRNQEIRIKAPESVGEYSAVVEVRSRLLRKLGRTIRFYNPEIVRVEVRSLPLLVDQSGALTRTDEGFELHTDRLTPDADLFVINVNYRLRGSGFLDAIVRRDYDLDPRSTESHSEYWMSAQLRHLNLLQSRYGRIDLRDVDFRVDVAIHQDVLTSVPRAFIHELEVVSRLIHETEREKKVRLALDHLRTRSGTVTGKESEILAQIQDLFAPSRFRAFVDVKNAFRYADVRKGLDYFGRIPFPTFPRQVTVVSRTDLSLDKPAAHGTLIYKKADFQKTLAEIFPDALWRHSSD
jgi:hypothetical protein